MPFKPSLALTVVLLLLAILFLRLGWWQLERKADKTLLFEQFKQAPQLAIGEALERGETFARVEARGRYDPVRHILLDNKILNGRAGVHVLSPFVLNRDDLAAPARDHERRLSVIRARALRLVASSRQVTRWQEPSLSKASRAHHR